MAKKDSIHKSAKKYEEIILKYFRNYPYLSFRKLAQLIITENNLEYDLEYFRLIVSECLKGRDIVENILDDEKEFDFDDIPSSVTEIKDYELPPKYQRILIINDIHIKYHDNKALKIALKYGWDNECDTIVLNGDIVDFAGISRFNKSYIDRNIAYERNLVIMFLERLREKFKNQKIVFKAGNHELRLTKFIQDNAEQLEGIEELEIDKFFKLDKFGIEYVDAYSVIKIGSLNIIHGHEIIGSGINVARMHFLKALDNIIFGHFHRTQDYIQRSIGNKTFGSWSVGCLCSLKPLYYPINNWNHGFAFVIRDNNYFKVENKKIINGLVL